MEQTKEEQLTGDELYMQSVKDMYVEIQNAVQNSTLFSRKMDFSGILVTDNQMQLVVCAYFYGLVQSQLKPTVVEDEDQV